jgi:hypothetical protein
MRSWRSQERALIEDARRDGAMVRVTWHERDGLFVISHWRDNVCVAASRVDVHDAGPLIGVLVDGLSSAVNHHPEPVPQPPSRLERLIDQFRRRAA